MPPNHPTPDPEPGGAVCCHTLSRYAAKAGDVLPGGNSRLPLAAAMLIIADIACLMCIGRTIYAYFLGGY